MGLECDVKRATVKVGSQTCCCMQARGKDITEQKTSELGYGAKQEAFV